MTGRTVTAVIEAHQAKIDSKLDAYGARFDALESKLDTLPLSGLSLPNINVDLAHRANTMARGRLIAEPNLRALR